MADGIDKIVDKVGAKAKGLDLSNIRLDMPGGTPPIPEDKVQGKHRKAVVLLAQREQANTWHVIKVVRKPAVHGLVFYWDKKLYVMDTGKVWYYDENSNPVIMYDVGRMIPVKRDIDGTLVITPNAPKVPDSTDAFVKADNIDSGFAYTMLVKRLLEQLARASAPEPKTLDMITILLMVAMLIAGLGVGLFAGPSVMNDVPRGTCPFGYTCTPIQITTTTNSFTTSIGGTTCTTSTVIPEVINGTTTYITSNLCH